MEPSSDCRARLTALQLSAVGRDSLLLQRVLGYGPELGATDVDGNTPLHHAAARGRVETVRLLLAAGARPEIRNVSGRTVLQEAEESGRRRVAELLKLGEERPQR